MEEQVSLRNRNNVLVKELSEKLVARLIPMDIVVEAIVLEAGGRDRGAKVLTGVNKSAIGMARLEVLLFDPVLEEGGGGVAVW